MPVTNLIEQMSEAFEVIFDGRAAPDQEVTFAVSLTEDTFEESVGDVPALRIFVALADPSLPQRMVLSCSLPISDLQSAAACASVADNLWERIQARQIEYALMAMGPAEDD